MRKSTILITFFLLAASVSVFAGNKPLLLDSSTPAEGAVNVAVDTEIIINFSKNVVNFTVADHNSACFTLIDSEDNEVAIDVYLPDDQLEPEKKRTITVTPLEPLTAASEYTLKISGAMKAKNGVTLGEDKSISFTTAD